MPTRRISRAIRRPCGTESQELRPTSESASLMDFLTVIQKQNVTILPLSYNKGLAILGRGLAGMIQQSTADVTTSLAFKEGVPSKHEYDTEQEQDWYSLLTEIVILQHPTINKNPHFVDLIGVSFYVEPCRGIEKWRAWPLLVTRKANMGDLNSVIRDISHSKLTDLTRLQLFAEIAEALHVLHSCGVAHGDIKPGNILVETQESEINCMLIDFGSSVVRGQVRLPTTDEPWSAPELDGQVGSLGYEEIAQTDIFACGLVLVHLLLPQDALQRKDLCLVRQPGQTDEQWTDLIGKIVHMKRSDGGKTIGARILEVVEGCDISEERKGILHDVVIFMICARAGGRSLPWDKISPHIEMFLSRSFENDKIGPVLSPPLAFNSPSLGHPDHIKFNLAEALGELDDVDYVLRANITQDITRKASGSACKTCKTDYTFQLAMCHAIGFGCARDVKSVQTLLSQSCRSQIDLDEAIKDISSTYRVPGKVDGAVLESFGIGVLVSAERSQEYQVSRRLEIAERSIRAEIRGREDAFGEHHCCNAKLRLELALVLKAQGRLKDAQFYQQGAVDVLTKRLGERHPSALLANIVLADIFSEQGLLHQAVELHYKVQPILSDVFGPEHPETITAQQILANTAALLGQYKQAEEICRGVVDARTKILSQTHPLTLRAQLNLISMLRAQGMLTEASSIMKRVEDLFHDTLAGDDLTNAYLNMVRAMLCKDLILLERAYECVTEATHALNRLNLPVNDPLRLSMLEVLASIHREKEDWKKEEAVLRQVLRAKGLFDDTHERNREHYTTKCLLVDSLLSQLKLDDAEALAKQILASHIQSIDADPENFISCERALAKVLTYRGQWEMAETRYQNLLSSCKTQLGVDNPLTWDVTYSLGKFLADQGLYNEAQAHYNAILQHFRDTSRLGKDASGVARQLSIAYKEAGHFMQARKICEEGIEWATATMSAEHAETLDLYNTLVDIYTQMGELSKAEDLHRTHLETQCQGTYMEIWVKDHLARLRKAQGRHQEAVALKIEAHQMILQRRGNMHPDVLKMGGSLLQEKMNSGVLSNEVVNEVLEFIDLKKQVLGEHHPSVLHTKSNLAYAFASNERLSEAEKLFHEIIEFGDAGRIQNPQFYASLLAKMAEVQFRMSDLEKAEEFERRGLELRQRTFGDKHRLVLLSMTNLASTLHARGEEIEAEKYLRLVVAGYGQLAKGGNMQLIYQYLKSRISLAAVLYSQKVPQHAEELIELYTTTIHAATLSGLPTEIVTVWKADLNHVLQDVSASDTAKELPV